jgi:hypothetical protein
MYFYNNVSNIVWEHVYKFETNLMNTNDPKSLLKQCNQCLLSNQKNSKCFWALYIHFMYTCTYSIL